MMIAPIKSSNCDQTELKWDEMRLYQAKKMDEATYTNNQKSNKMRKILGIVLMKIAIERNELT